MACPLNLVLAIFILSFAISSSDTLTCGPYKLECNEMTEFCDKAMEECQHCSVLCGTCNRGYCERHCPLYWLSECVIPTQAEIATPTPSLESQTSGERVIWIGIAVILFIVIVVLVALYLLRKRIKRLCCPKTEETTVRQDQTELRPLNPQPDPKATPMNSLDRNGADSASIPVHPASQASSLASTDTPTSTPDSLPPGDIVQVHQSPTPTSSIPSSHNERISFQPVQDPDVPPSTSARDSNETVNDQIQIPPVAEDPTPSSSDTPKNMGLALKSFNVRGPDDGGSDSPEGAVGGAAAAVSMDGQSAATGSSRQTLSLGPGLSHVQPSTMSSSSSSPPNAVAQSMATTSSGDTIDLEDQQSPASSSSQPTQGAASGRTTSSDDTVDLGGERSPRGGRSLRGGRRSPSGGGRDPRGGRDNDTTIPKHI